MISLLDVNFLIALFDSAHLHHASAHAWLARNRGAGWATCPITQNGCIRVMSQPNYPGRLSVAEIVRRLAAAIAVRDHHFWPDSLSLCSRSFAPDKILSAKLLTDTYLLGLSVKNRGRLATFDRTIPLAAVPTATQKHLLVL